MWIIWKDIYISFYANKHVTTGEGGAVLTDSDSDYEKLKK